MSEKAIIEEGRKEDVVHYFLILEENLKEMYEKTIGWDRQFKLDELNQPQMKYVAIRDEHRNVIAFCSYTEEFGTEVEDAWIIYCYELQVRKSHQACGLGSKLMDHLEERARTLGAKKIILTWFCINKGAMRFYTKRGYVVDDTSPEGNVPYRILSLLCNFD